MEFAKTGEIRTASNAILTFKEYLIDYASPETRRVGEKAIKAHLAMIPSEKVERRREAPCQAGAG